MTKVITAFGAKDGAPDSTAAIQAAISAASQGETVQVPAGTFMVNGLVGEDNFMSGGLFLKSNMTLELDAGAVLKAIPNNSTHYTILTAKGCNNLTITGTGKIIGDRDTHPVPNPDPGQWGFGLVLMQSQNVKVFGPTISKCYGDGLVIYDGTNIAIDHVIFDSNKRQNMSLSSVNGLTLTNNTFMNAGMVNLDFETEFATTQTIQNVVVKNCNFQNCCTLAPIGSKKVHLGLGSMPGYGVYKNINISDCQFDLRMQPIWAHDNAGTTGIPPWAAALNGIFYQGMKADWYRFWGYPTTWQSKN